MLSKSDRLIASPHLQNRIARSQIGHMKGHGMISCQLSTLMGARRLSQTRMAQLVGVHRNTIRKLYANNWTSIRRDTLNRICAVLQVSVGDLLVWHNEQRPD